MVAILAAAGGPCFPGQDVGGGRRYALDHCVGGRKAAAAGGGDGALGLGR